MQSDTVECKPTMWFTGRAVIMALMFLGFGVYFYYDASTGYPQKNLEFFMHKAFVDAVDFPEGYEIPSNVNRNAVPWPDILADYSLMSTPGKGWSAAWQSYSGEKRYPIKPVDHPYDASKIFEQWVAGCICLALAMVALFFLVRTRGRKMSLNGKEVTAAGVVFRVDDIARLDLRRWKLKGLAIATLKPECGGARIRLDGLTYGGFRKEDSPHNAEDFMKALLSLYRGEIVDYEEIPDAGGPPARQEDEERAV